ncbi:uncharacterized protein TNCV_2781671 [Trichonephila clavipes]|nr:uncharacterized protein TNCV_2781671 [Trichonephila clavipes]
MVILHSINALKNIIGNVEKRQEPRNILKKKIEQVEERYETVAGNFSLISRVEDFEKKLLACRNATNGSKFVPAVLSTCLTSVSETVHLRRKNKLRGVQDSIWYISEANQWTEEVKACQLVPPLRGEADEVLQTLTDTELLNLNSIYNALDLRFGQKLSKDYARLQMKTRHQKPKESLQEYAFEMQRLTTFAFSDFSANVREMIFLDGLKDEEIQIAVRMADFKDLKSALLYALKVEAATQASCKDHHFIREARVTAQMSPVNFDVLRKLKEEMQDLIAQRQNRRCSITCWGCGESGHQNWQDIASFHPTTKRYWALWDSLHLRNGVSYRKWESDDGKTFKWQLIPPNTRISTVLKELHDSPTGGHFDVMKTLQKVRERFYWNNVRSDVEKYCCTCDTCAARKGPRKRTRGRLQLYNVGARFE